MSYIYDIQEGTVLDFFYSYRLSKLTIEQEYYPRIQPGSVTL